MFLSSIMLDGDGSRAWNEGSNVSNSFKELQFRQQRILYWRAISNNEGLSTLVVDPDTVVSRFSPREDNSGSRPSNEEGFPSDLPTSISSSGLWFEFEYQSRARVCVDEVGKLLPFLQIPLRCLSCAASKFQVAYSKLFGPVALQQFWDRVLANRPHESGYGIAVLPNPAYCEHMGCAVWNSATMPPVGDSTYFEVVLLFLKVPEKGKQASFSLLEGGKLQFPLFWSEPEGLSHVPEDFLTRDELLAVKQMAD
ncbi:uncharacterized protein G2W53_000981 [Senna tora]|uniref:Uncharacterized protein n=1 Tax=Senna tora TaxID=362788 RepID=A0A835CI76_9FABA|nr:uncharacterized protein G2W53_000981 [Senna tora]